MAEVRESEAVVRIHVRVPRQETALYGRGVRAVVGVEPGREPRLASTAVSSSLRITPLGARSEYGLSGPPLALRTGRRFRRFRVGGLQRFPAQRGLLSQERQEACGRDIVRL